MSRGAEESPNFDDPEWMPERDESYLEVRVVSVTPSESGQVVLLQPYLEPSRLLPVLVGAPEAQSILNAMQQATVVRPGTHDLIRLCVEACKARVSRVAITHLMDKTFYGRVWMVRGGTHEVSVDSRPSDAIAVALRFRAPVWMNRHLLDTAGISLEMLSHSPSNQAMAFGMPGGGLAVMFGLGSGSGSSSGGSSSERDPGLDLDLKQPPMSEMSSATIAAMYRRKNPYKPDIVLRLERQMQESIAREDYKEAARLRDEIRKLYPLDHLRTAMKRAVAAENYEEAARIRDEIVAWKIAHDPDMRPNTKRRTEGEADEPPKDVSADTTESRGEGGEGGEKERGGGGASSTGGGNAGNGGSTTAEGTDVAKDTDDPDTPGNPSA